MPMSSADLGRTDASALALDVEVQDVALDVLLRLLVGREVDVAVLVQRQVVALDVGRVGLVVEDGLVDVLAHDLLSLGGACDFIMRRWATRVCQPADTWRRLGLDACARGRGRGPGP